MKLVLPKNKKSVAKTLLLSYAAVILVCLMVIFVIMFRYENIIRKENENLSNYFFSSVSQSVRWALDDIQKLNIQIKEDASIQSIIKSQTESNYWNTQSTLDGINQLKNFAENRNNVDLVFIYLKMSDEVVSCHGILSSNMFYNLYFEKSGISYEDWLAILKDNKKESYINLNVDLDQQIISSLAFLSPSSMDKNAVSVIMMDKKKFLQDVDQFEMDNAFDVYIYNSYDRLFFYEQHNSDNEPPYTVSELEKQIQTDKKSIYTMHKGTASMQWCIATAIPRRMVDSKILIMRIVTIVCVLFALAVLYILIKYFIKRNTEYLEKVTSILKLEPQENEYRSLFQSVEQLLTENRSLKYEQSEKGAFLRQILLKGIFKGDAASVLQGDEYGITFPGAYFSVITFYLDDIETLFADEQQMSAAKRKEYLQFIIQNVFEESFNNNICTYVTEVDGMPVCLVNLRSGTEQEFSVLKSIADERINFLNKNFDLELSFVLSDLFLNSAEIPTAYVKTLEVLEYKKRMGIQENLICNEVTFDYSDGYLFNIERESKLIKAIKSGNADEAIDVVEPILRILENNQKFSREYISCIVQDILTVITRTASELPNGGSMIESGIAINQKVQSKTITEIHLIILERLKEVCKLAVNWEDKNNDKTSKLMQRVIDYVENNYSDPLLNIASIGDHFDMSPYYVSKLFKEETGIALIDYINRYRIQKAKELMENSNLSGKAIAEKVGFNHVRSFYRLLKKHISDIEE